MGLALGTQRVGECGLVDLIEDSQDVHAEAKAVARGTVPDLADFASGRRGAEIEHDSDAIAEFERSREALIERLALAVGGALGIGVATVLRCIDADRRCTAGFDPVVRPRAVPGARRVRQDRARCGVLRTR